MASFKPPVYSIQLGWRTGFSRVTRSTVEGDLESAFMGGAQQCDLQASKLAGRLAKL
jgi:hypothetical protein